MRYAPRRNQYKKYFNAISEVAAKKNLPPSTVALEVVKEKQPEIRQYVKNAGLRPDDNPVNLSIQAAMVHENKVLDKLNRGFQDYTAAENAVFAEDEVNSFMDDYQDFAPALLAMVGAVAGKGIEGINAKREQAGKKPILSGKFWQNLKNKAASVEARPINENDLQVNIRGRDRIGANPNTELGAGILAARVELENQAKKDYLRRNLPLFIIAAVVIIAGIIYFTKKK